MQLQQLLAKKKLGQELSEEEINTFIQAVVTEDPAYEAQIGALLMAIAIKGMVPRETMWLTKAMVNTGGPNSAERLKWEGIAVDKHSTGGVGDKVSIPLAPILAELGFIVPMISGRGLEITGGTLDKLESIRGFRVNLSKQEMSAALDKCGVFIASTTSSICPADKRTYAIRDITATVDSTPLVVASILSKKIAEGANYLIQDIKVGNAAFYKDVKSAEELANTMIATTKEFNDFKMAATLTRMDSPIGVAVGNSLEIEESLLILKGEHFPQDLIELICTLGSQLLVMTKKVATVEEGKEEILSIIKTGKALKRFADMCICQGVTPKDAQELCFGDSKAILGTSNYETEIKATLSGGPNSAERLKWEGIAVDKHSTGGVGDKVSIPLAPILAELGFIVPMISGRGLEITGGTLDKLESIRGFRVNLSKQEMSAALDKCGVFIASTTSSICPADKRTYAIRDITATVDSTPLVVASILSKKIAEGANYLIQDIKVGNAAFYKDVKSAEELANTMIATTKEFNDFKMAATLTRMDSPIGVAVGNSLEIEESLLILKGEHFPQDLIELICTLGSQLLVMTKKVATVEEGKEEILSIIKTGKALKRFADMCICQGVTPKDAQELCFGDSKAILGTSNYETEIKATLSGFIKHIDAQKVGKVCWQLGSGRTVKEDIIDYHVGCKLLLKPGDKIKMRQTWAVLHHSKPLPEDIQNKMYSAIEISNESVKYDNIVIKTIAGY